MTMDFDFTAISEAVLKGDIEAVRQQVKHALDLGLPVTAILNQGLIQGMDEVGKLFRRDEIYLPEVLLSAEAMRAGFQLIEPLLKTSNTSALLGKIVMGTVHGDIHDLGKNLVIMMLRGAGFEVIDLGVNVPSERVIKAVIEHNPDVVGLSALLTTTMPSMAQTVEVLRNTPSTSQVKVIVGGAPVTAEYAASIGADGYAPDAANAVDLVKGLLVRQ